MPQHEGTDVEGLEEFILGLPVEDFTVLENNGVKIGPKHKMIAAYEENSIKNHPKYMKKEEFYRKVQFSYLPKEAETQTQIKTYEDFSVQIVDGIQWVKPKRKRFKS